MKHIKIFKKTDDYIVYKSDLEHFIIPNVSYVEETEGVVYKTIQSISNATITCDSVTYDGQSHIATNIVVTLYGETLVNEVDYTISGNNGGTNAGNYTFTINGIGSYIDSKQGTFTINKLTPTVTAPTAKVLTFNGTAQELVNAGSTNYGTLKYSLDNSTWSTSIPTATNYGSYTVYYKVEGDSNHNDVAPSTVQCSINEKQVTATVELSEDIYTYDGTAKEPTVTVKDGSTIIDPSEYSVAYSNNINAGTATVTISDNVGGNYEVIGSATFTINKASRTISWVSSPSSVTNGSSITVEAAPSLGVGDGTITYSSSDTTKATVNGNIVSGISLGSCTITATISEGTNYLSANTTYVLRVIDERVVAKFNVTSTSSPTQIISEEAYELPFSAIEIDGVAQPSVVSEYTFSTTGEHTVKYTLIDPATIGMNAFADCSSLTSIDIPNTVTSIGMMAFGYCSNLTSIVIPNSVTSIGSMAFDDTPWWNTYSADTSHHYGNIIYINDIAYKATSESITSATCKSETIGINQNAFSRCTSLTSCTISSGVTTIGNGAFDGCTSLTSIDIPDGVTSIGYGAFRYCSGLTSCTIGSGVTTIDESVFVGCTSLSSITVNSNNTTFDSRNNCNAIIETSTNTLIQGFKNTLIPNSVTSIGSYAFNGCTSLTSIDIPDSVTTIGSNAFYECSGLTSVNIPSGVTTIDYSTFKGCSSLTSIDIPDSVTEIGAGAFQGCTGLTSIEIPSGVTSIEAGVFYYCPSLTSVNIPSGVTTIGKDAFYECYGLTSIEIPSGVTSIGRSAFENCTNLASIVSNATTAPTIESSTFQNVKTGGTLTVPQGSSGYDVWMGTGYYYLGYSSWTKVEQ